MPGKFSHPDIPLPENVEELSLGDLIQMAIGRGIGNFERKTNELIPWTAETLADKIYDSQVSRFGEVTAQRPGEDTIKSWMAFGTRGPSSKYWIDFIRCIAPQTSAAHVNDRWRVALEGKRIDFHAKKRLKRRVRTEAEITEPGITAAASQPPDLSALIAELDAVRADPALRFASPLSMAERLVGTFQCTLQVPEADTVSQLLSRLLHNTLVRGAIRLDANASNPGMNWDCLKAAFAVQIGEVRVAFTAGHLLSPEIHPVLAAFAQTCAQRLGRPVEEIGTMLQAAHFEELGQSLVLYRPLVDKLVADLADSASLWATLQFTCHHHLLSSTLHRPMLSDPFSRGGEPFSIQDIYVNLPVEPDVGAIEDDEDSYADEDAAPTQTQAAFSAFCTAPWNLGPDKANFFTLRGLPGSGKSTAVRINAAALQAHDSNLAVVFLPLQKHGPFLESDGTLVLRGETPPGFLPNPDGLDLVALFELSRFRRLLIVLDGLDELGSQSEHQSQVAGLSRALRLVDHAGKSKPIKFVLAGRHQAFTHLAYPELRDEDVFRLIGMARPKFLVQRDGPTMVESDLGYVFDHRMEWFGRYMQFKYGLTNLLRPNVLKSHFHQLADLTFEPLLLFLLFRLGENLSQQLHYFTDDGRQIPDFDRIFEMGEMHGLSKNDLYQMIIWSIRNPVHRDRSAIEAPSRQGGLPENAFEKTLGCLAIAAWRNGSGRRATVKEFLDEADRQGLREEALRFVSTARGRDPDSAYANLSLLSVFYFEGFQREGSDTDEFEFTHKSFADYLVAAHVFEESVRLVAALETTPLAHGDERIARLVDLVGDGDESIEICQFLQEEGIRYGRRRTILFKTDRGLLHLYPRQGQELPLIDPHRLEPIVWEMAQGDTRARRAARFIVAIWDAIVEGDETGQHGAIAPGQFSFKSLYTRIVDPITFDELDAINSSLVPTNIAKYAINNWDLDGADLSGLNLINAGFYSCSLVGAKLAATPLCNSGFNHCDLRDAFFVNCDMTSGHFFYSDGFDATACQFQLAIFEEVEFQEKTFDQVNFRDAEWISASFERCAFRGCDFSSGYFRAATFNGCTFTLCAFDAIETEKLEFKDCKFETCSGVRSNWDANED